MSTRKLRLCILVFGIVVSMISLTPPCSPIKIQTQSFFDNSANVEETNEEKANLKSRISEIMKMLGD